MKKSLMLLIPFALILSACTVIHLFPESESISSQERESSSSEEQPEESKESQKSEESKESKDSKESTESKDSKDSEDSKDNTSHSSQESESTKESQSSGSSQGSESTSESQSSGSQSSESSQTSESQSSSQESQSESQTSEGPYNPIASQSTANFYFGKTTAQGTLTTYRMNQKGAVDYVEFGQFYNKVYASVWGSSNYSYFEMNTPTNPSSGIYEYKNQVGEITLDIDNERMSFDSYVYLLSATSRTDYDVPYIADGYESRLCSINDSTSKIVKTGTLPVFELKQYSIDFIGYNGKAYIPLQTGLDIFMSGVNGFTCAYNGKDIYYTGNFSGDMISGDATAYEKQFYNQSPWKNQTTRDSALAEFTYNELCFSLDYFYGLKEYREISSFDTLFTDANLKANLKSTNTKTYEQAMIKFGYQYLFDGHAGYTTPSPSVAQTYNSDSSYDDVASEAASNNPKYIQLYGDMYELTAAREDAGKGIGLRTFNNVAVITFDSFVKSGNTSTSYSNLDSTTYEVLAESDTYLFFAKAFKEITADTSIEKIVFDVTCNGGGMVDALPFLEGFMTDSPFIVCKDTLTGEFADVKYKVDLNQDGTKGGTGDTYQGQYDFYVMTSNFSFSCGNAFPTFVKAGHMATIIGETSGGGSCAVGGLSTATGTILRMSSTNQFGTYSGTTFTPNEGGVTPDRAFARSNFYNDTAIYNFVNQ